MRTSIVFHAFASIIAVFKSIIVIVILHDNQMIIEVSVGILGFQMVMKMYGFLNIDLLFRFRTLFFRLRNLDLRNY